MQQGSGGIRSVVEDSSRTNLAPGQGVYDGGWQITGRHGSVTMDTIRAGEAAKAAEGSPVPAVEAADEGDEEGGDCAPAQSQDEPEFSPEKVKADLFQWSLGEGGFVDKRRAKSVFLIQHDRGESADDYELPIATIGENGEPVMSQQLLDNAFDHASGKYNGLAHRGLQNRIIRAKRRAGYSLSSEQSEYIQRHMSGGRFYDVPTDVDVDEQIVKYDEKYRAALRTLHNTLRGK